MKLERAMFPKGVIRATKDHGDGSGLEVKEPFGDPIKLTEVL
jgi:hypothetical protein